MSQAAQNLNWLITNFVDNTPGVSHTVVVSADGLLLAMSEGFPRDRADQLAAVASGLTSLTAGASRIFEGGAVSQTVVEMERGFLFLMSISDGSSLAVLAHPEADIGLIGYEMALLVDRAGTVLTPDLPAELQGSLLNEQSDRAFWRPGAVRLRDAVPHGWVPGTVGGGESGNTARRFVFGQLVVRPRPGAGPG